MEVFVKMGGSIGQTGTLVADEICDCGYVLPAGSSISAYLPVFTDKINLLISQSGVDKEYTRVLLKSVGICFICQFSSDICNDSGQSALATKVELAGKILILISALPLMEEILEIASSLLSG